MSVAEKEGFMNDAGRKGVALLTGLGIGLGLALLSVSYTHLDVYKRQA